MSDSDLFSLSFAGAQAGVLAKERIVRMAQRDWSDYPAEARFPKWTVVESTLNIPERTLTLNESFDEAMKTKKVSARKRYRGCLEDFERFLGMRDLRTATPDRIQASVDDLASRMVGEGDAARRVVGDKTIKESHLAAARSPHRGACEGHSGPCRHTEAGEGGDQGGNGGPGPGCGIGGRAKSWFGSPSGA